MKGARSGFHAQVDDDGHAQKCLEAFLLLLLSKLLVWLFAFDIAHSSPPMDPVSRQEKRSNALNNLLSANANQNRSCCNRC